MPDVIGDAAGYGRLVDRAAAGAVIVIRDADGQPRAVLGPASVAEAVEAALDARADQSRHNVVAAEDRQPTMVQEVFQDVSPEADPDLPRSIVDVWQPLPERQMHRGQQHAFAVRSPGPDLVTLAVLDDCCTSLSVSLSAADARALSRLLDESADAAEERQ